MPDKSYAAAVPPILLLLLATLGGCDSQEETKPGLKRANPAAEYCLALGGILDLATQANGETGICTLPDGEKIEEWQLYRRDHKLS
ncbi:DUF333 domain-containing protein [Shewanella sp. AS16]|uniref:putative hemolysin n=1 Tax=Shewanella sp. AS16 TaxID=2907625 RepID=UPI001F41AE74|nr:DUF333 domain-containing protein [Shewanella sp. AS16]MCE9687869.1 DUF333 domain-containing protein [Shewanella sp. AS16]